MKKFILQGYELFKKSYGLDRFFLLILFLSTIHNLSIIFGIININIK